MLEDSNWYFNLNSISIYILGIYSLEMCSLNRKMTISDKSQDSQLKLRFFKYGNKLVS